MSVGKRLKNRVRRAVSIVTDDFEYGRHLVRGNKVSTDMSWTRPELPPVVLVHGFMGTRGTMLPLTRRFQNDGRVVFSYAYGTFNLASIRRSAENLTAHLRTICEELEVDRVDLVGYSMGGLISLHSIKFLQGHRYVRNLVMMGSPLRGTWAGLAGVATVGAFSPSVWQVLPGSPFLEDLLAAPAPANVRMRQIHAASDALCPPPGPVEGVAARDYIMLAGGHSSLVVAEHFYLACRDFFEADETQADESQSDESQADEYEHAEVEYMFEPASSGLRLVANGEFDHDAAE